MPYLPAPCRWSSCLIAMQYLISEPAHHEDDGPKPQYAWPKAPIVYILGLMALFSMVPEGAVLDWAALYLSKELGSSLSVSGSCLCILCRNHGDHALCRRRRTQPVRRGCNHALVGIHRRWRHAGGRAGAQSTGSPSPPLPLPDLASPTPCRLHFPPLAICRAFPPAQPFRW